MTLNDSGDAVAVDIRNNPELTDEDIVHLEGLKRLRAVRLIRLQISGATSTPAGGRLCEAGCGFVTVNYGGWDMHGRIERGLKRRSPALDQAVSAFLEDVHQRGLAEKILLVITGEFGRTPRTGGGAGRDHWAPLSTLALAGGGLQMGGTVGQSSPKAEYPKTSPITPQDLMVTLLHVLGIPPTYQYTTPSGRPVSAVQSGQPIGELL